MALSFPSDPINGAVSGEYTYDATKGAWRKNAAYPTSVTHSDVAPSNPRVGDQWWKSNEGTLFTYYNDGTSSQWVESTNVVASSDPNPIPAGAMMAWASDVIPANWLLCDGSAVSRSTYASLFASIGTTYGSGDGTTTFNVPNLKGRTIVGKDASQTEFDALAETGGAKTHTLITAEMPSHIHGTVAHSHTFSGTTSTGGSHSHTVQPQYRLSGGPVQLNGEALTGAPNNGLEGGFNGIRPTGTSADGSHSHTYSGTTSNSAPDTQSAGSGSPHNNLQPYIVLNYIIKFSAGETPGDSQLAVRVGAVEAANNATPLSENYIINGAFDIWQRGTSVSITSDASYSADRWVTYYNGSGATRTISRQTFTPGAAPVAGYEGTYFLRFAQSVAGSGASFTSIGQRIEDVRTLAGQTVTISFWAKAASTMTIPNMTFWQRFGDGGSSTANLDFGSSLTIGTSWTRYSYTVTLPSIAGKTIGANSYLHFEMYQPVNQTFTLDLWGVQLEAGPNATPFRRNSPNIQAELAVCQRYCVRLSTAGTTTSLNFFGTGSMYQATLGVAIVPYPVTMRAKPVVTTSAANTFQLLTSGSNITVSAIAGNPDNQGLTCAALDVTSSISIGSGAGFTFRGNGGGVNAWVQADAEL